MYIQVNFGRNIGDEPMSQGLWDGFTTDITQVMAHYAADMSGRDPLDFPANVECHDGVGMWGATPEDSRHLSLFWEDTTPADKRDFAEDLKAGERLRRDLRTVADRYNQDNVALIVGSELI